MFKKKEILSESFCENPHVYLLDDDDHEIKDQTHRDPWNKPKNSMHVHFECMGKTIKKAIT